MVKNYSLCHIRLRRGLPNLLARSALTALSVIWLAGSLGAVTDADQPKKVQRAGISVETAAAAARRHERVADRRKALFVICHRRASEFAHENTLEAFRASFELGADGNEIDIRSTKDGVLVCFHDDMLDRLLEAYGDVGDYTWEELQRFRFRDPGRFGDQCRIPTLVEVFELHRRFGGLIHLDIKRTGVDGAIADLLTRMDLWDHVISCNADTGGEILRDARFKPLPYKGGLYLDRGEVFPAAIAATLAKPGNGVIVDDPRGVVVALGWKLGKVSTNAVAPRPVASNREKPQPPDEPKLLAVLNDADDWNRVAETADQKRTSGRRILARAQAAERLLALTVISPQAQAVLKQRVVNRSLHKDWRYHGLDGAMAVRTLLLSRAPDALAVAREALWRDDTALTGVADPRYKNPRAWTDFRVKMLIFPALEHCPGPATEKLCRDYLALSDEQARLLAPPQFEEAAHALLTVSRSTATALELLGHRLQVVRGRTILDCLPHGNEPWARQALEKGARHALAYLIAE